MQKIKESTEFESWLVIMEKVVDKDVSISVPTIY